MNRVIFKKIKIKNFLSVANQEFDFIEHQGLNYIFGTNQDVDGTKNGSGKSAIFAESILFCLFGRTSKNIANKFIPSRLLPGREDCEVSLTLDIDDCEYEISAGLTFNFYSFFRLIENGVDISKSSIKETREFFETQILKTTYDVFKNNAVLTLNDSQKFFSMPKGVKREFVEGIFRLNIFGEILKKVRNDINSLEKETLAVQRSLTQMDETIENIKDNSDNFEKDKDKRVSDIETKITDKNTKISELCTRILETNKLAKSLSGTVQADTLEKHKKYNSTFHKAEAALKLSKMHITKNEELINKHEDILTLICDSCRETVSDKYDIDSAKETIVTETKKLGDIEKLITVLKTKKEEIEQKKKDEEAEIKKKDKAEADLKNMASILTHHKSELKDLKETLRNEITATSPFSNLLADAIAKRDQMNKDLGRYYVTKKEMMVIQHLVSEDGVKKFIIKDIIDLLNIRIKRYLDELGANYACIVDSSFNCDFLTESGPTSYENFSCGERARIDIAILFAFKDIISSMGTNSSSILVIDEVIDIGLDKYAVDAIVKILKDIAQTTNQSVYLISHRAEIEADEFDNIIEVVKRSGISTILRDGDVNL